ncbi:hypothetical protein ACOI9X_19515 [Pseudomonas sp. P2757]|uniref:hypothetical protein n=1 Tax=unclassified Pseudomonas TaxID=196821 RepID=UPI003B5BC649
MNNPASSGGPIVALALTKPDIPSKTYPISYPGAEVGVSRLNYYADPRGLLVLCGPYWGQLPNETGRIFINGSPAPVPVQITKDTTSPFEFFLPPSMFPDGVTTLKVSVQRQSSNEDSSELSVLHYLEDPAGNDTDQNPGNSLLSIDVTPKSIGPNEAVAGVKARISYPGMAPYDLLTVNYGGKTLTHQLVPTLQDPNPESRPVELTFYAADFAHDPNNRQFVFKCNVINQVGDFSGTSSMGVFNSQKFWSKACEVDVHLDWAELLEAILQEILGDNGDNPAIVDLGKMNGGPLWALVHLIPSIWQAGDEIHLIFEALLNGAVVATHDETLPITNVPGLFSWQIPNAKVIANSQVRIKYERLRAGTGNAPSKTATANVIGGSPTTLKEDFSLIPTTVLAVGQSANIGQLTITNIRHDRISGDFTGVGPVIHTGKSQCLKINDIVRVSLNGLSGMEIKYSVRNTQTANSIEFFDASGNSIITVPDLTQTPLRMPIGKPFSSFAIYAQIVPGSGNLRDYIELDDIEVKLT